MHVIFQTRYFGSDGAAVTSVQQNGEWIMIMIVIIIIIIIIFIAVI